MFVGTSYTEVNDVDFFNLGFTARQDYFTHFEPSQSFVGAKTGDPRDKNNNKNKNKNRKQQKQTNKKNKQKEKKTTTTKNKTKNNNNNKKTTPDHLACLSVTGAASRMSNKITGKFVLFCFLFFSNIMKSFCTRVPEHVSFRPKIKNTRVFTNPTGPTLQFLSPFWKKK